MLWDLLDAAKALRKRFEGKSGFAPRLRVNLVDMWLMPWRNSSRLPARLRARRGINRETRESASSDQPPVPAHPRKPLCSPGGAAHLPDQYVT